MSMWATGQYTAPPRAWADPSKPVPNLPTEQDYKEDDILLFSILAHKPPTAEEFLRYKPRDWNKLEHLESYMTMRKTQRDGELNVLRAARGRAIADLEQRFFLAMPSRQSPAYAELLPDIEEQQRKELEILDRRWKRMEQIVEETYLRDVLDKQKIRKQIIADPQPKNYPPVRPPRSWDEFKLYPSYMKHDFARLLYRHVDNQLFKAQLRDSKWHKDKEVADFDAVRDAYRKDRLFREYMKRDFDVIRDW
ncbi:hypothetical protein CALCODRAFT_479597 [Calocera cornea HHB12733]|uniref:Uncharacterized protein n=1 Tax=Calocera cornea HHB12733 TaxID=1353952 RepID=A0A165JGY3_9BASI|nr:hypothetical protein CALCODRAFT_479597 [Calocera cornea HHB12733]